MRRRVDILLRGPWSDRAGKTSLHSLLLTAPRRSGLLLHPRTEERGSCQRLDTSRFRYRPPRKPRYPTFYMRSKRPCLNGPLRKTSPRLSRRRDLSTDASRRESIAAVASEGRRTWHARAIDGKRVRKRSPHAAADLTMAF